MEGGGGDGAEDCKGGGGEVGKRDQAVIRDCINVRYEAQELNRNPRDAQPIISLPITAKKKHLSTSGVVSCGNILYLCG